MSDEAPYSNRELRQIHEDMSKDISEVKDITLAGLEQAKITNGRVGKLENWRWFMTGGIAIITVIVLPVIFYLI